MAAAAVRGVEAGQELDGPILALFKWRDLLDIKNQSARAGHFKVGSQTLKNETVRPMHGHSGFGLHRDFDPYKLYRSI